MHTMHRPPEFSTRRTVHACTFEMILECPRIDFVMQFVVQNVYSYVERVSVECVLDQSETGVLEEGDEG